LRKSKNIIQYTYEKALSHSFYKYVMMITGIPVYLIAFILYVFRKKDDKYGEIKATVFKQTKKDLYESLLSDYEQQLRDKAAFFNQKTDENHIRVEAKKWAAETINEIVDQKVSEKTARLGVKENTFKNFFVELLGKRHFLVFTFIPGLLMYLFIFIFMNAYVKYIFDRLVMTFFVIIGVIFFVFTLLYISPLDPAANILGVTATKEQIANFNQLYGLDQPYFVQLWDAIRGIFTFDLDLSYEGNQDVGESILRRFPITAQLAFLSLIVSVIVAIPIGIISATRQNTFADYSFMFFALLGLSIPNFWLGLIFILTFSIKLQLLPATFYPGNFLSIIMPVIALGTALAASIARMTRASVLEVIQEDYILTARSKGLSSSKVLWRHVIPNAMIPIITLIGLQFGGMLGGAAITEKVFNISGIGSFIVDKQFIPDVPSVMAGVVYVAITISIVNVLIDIMYAFFDPRIRSKMKEY